MVDDRASTKIMTAVFLGEKQLESLFVIHFITSSDTNPNINRLQVSLSFLKKSRSKDVKYIIKKIQVHEQKTFDRN